jgi:DNA-binding transcriptional MerR regulator
MERRQDDLLSIGRFAVATGLSRKALRLYAELGLLAPAHIDRWTGYRYYGPEQLRPARLIRLMREMEMPLGDIRRVLDAPPDVAERLIAAHEHAFAERLERARQVGRQLMQTIRPEEKAMTLNVETRELAPQQVVSVEGHVLVGKLDDFIRSQIEQLAAFVTAQGGQVSGPPLGLYHGQVNQQDDGPVEVCLPAEGMFRAEGNVRIRMLPGGHGAVAVAEGEYTHFPKILEAYDAGYDWIVRHGHKMVESPREVWVGWPENDGPFEIVWRYE